MFKDGQLIGKAREYSPSSKTQDLVEQTAQPDLECHLKE